MIRKCIQIAVGKTAGEDDLMLALCNDGTIWRWQYKFGGDFSWVKIKSPPEGNES
jgi:hypothetical protein